MAVKQREAGVDRLGVDGDVHRAGFRRFVDHDLAFGLVETAHLVGIAEVRVLEARRGVAGVQDVGFRCGLGSQGHASGDQQSNDFFHSKTPVGIDYRDGLYARDLCD
ncbi:hypothetical protein FQZ97_1251660 [compost metagenome]